jgi:hypothetical protein
MMLWFAVFVRSQNLELADRDWGRCGFARRRYAGWQFDAPLE